MIYRCPGDRVAKPEEYKGASTKASPSSAFGSCIVIECLYKHVRLRRALPREYSWGLYEVMYGHGSSHRRRVVSPFLKLQYPMFLTSSYRDVAGVSHITFSIAATFAKELSRSELEPLVGAALVRTRYLVPSIAMRVNRPQGKEYQLSYEVPKSAIEAQEWAKEVLFFEENHGGRFENHDALHRDQWWKAGDNKHVHQLHVAPE